MEGFIMIIIRYYSYIYNMFIAPYTMPFDKDTRIRRLGAKNANYIRLIYKSLLLAQDDK